MTRASPEIPTFTVPDPTRAEQREALWRMSPAERVAAMYRGDLSLFQCLAWAARYPEQVPLWEWRREFRRSHSALEPRLRGAQVVEHR